MSYFKRLIHGAHLALAVSLLAPIPVHGQDFNSNGAPFTTIYAFGDSITDPGNFFELSGYPPSPYFEGRFTNGPVWIEYLAEELGMVQESIVNYAVGGATTGRDNYFDIPGVADFPGLLDQIDFFEEALDGKKADPRALYSVWAGGNDLFLAGGSPQETITAGVENTLTAITRLHQLGARRILVHNVPDLGPSPTFAENGLSSYFTNLTADYNLELAIGLDYLESIGISTIRVDAASFTQKIIANPGDYGVSNVTDAYLWTGGDPEEFYYWDEVHVTTTGHYAFALEAMDSLRHHFRHAWSTPRGRNR